jgi:hypothetical protein
MDVLTDRCIEYVATNISSVINLPIDLSCLSGKILKKIASKIEVTVIDNLKDRKDKLISKLFMKKLELMLEEERNSLGFCVLCKLIFPKREADFIYC